MTLAESPPSAAEMLVSLGEGRGHKMTQEGAETSLVEVPVSLGTWGWTLFQVGGTMRTCEQGSWGSGSEGHHVCQATAFAPDPGAGGLALGVWRRPDGPAGSSVGVGRLRRGDQRVK